MMYMREKCGQPEGHWATGVGTYRRRARERRCAEKTVGGRGMEDKVTERTREGGKVRSEVGREEGKEEKEEEDVEEILDCPRVMYKDTDRCHELAPTLHYLETPNQGPA